MCIFYSLKSFYIGGSILNYRNRYKEICQTLGICESNLRQKIGALKKLGYITTDKKHLYLVSNERVTEQFEIYTKKKHKFNFTKNIKQAIESLAIEDNIQRQVYALKQKLVNKEVADAGIIDTRSFKKLRIHISKNLEQVCRAEFLRSKSDIINDEYQHINTQTTLSRQGVANMLERKSKSTGRNRINKMRRAGYMSDTPNRLFIKRCSYLEYKEALLPSRKFRYIKGCVYLILCNILVPKVK